MAGLAGKAEGLRYSRKLAAERLPLVIDEERRETWRSRLEEGLRGKEAAGPARPELPAEEERICADIRAETESLNRNNLTRTDAYWRVYREHPELRWAFLAHMVSRNGGWNMTDLKGRPLSRLLDERLAADIFGLLESCNSLIFGDAYPQLRLYAESRRLGRPLFHLLARFGVSVFMEPLWRDFWTTGEPLAISEALIVNEQHYIQARVVEDPYYRENVFGSLAFKGQPLLQTNQTVFPLWKGEPGDGGKPMRLAGRVLENFEDLRERIEYGKCLYGLLFAYPKVLRSAVAFARHVPHTGSRADYWPHRYTARRHEKGDAPVCTECVAGDVRIPKWLSPPLQEAWPDRPLRRAEERDWCRGPDALAAIATIRPPRTIDLTHEHLFGQRKLQAAELLERSLMNGASKRRTGLG
ncbi:DUF2515 family protein [Paenibacillaceae bacterium WGS1546]|uniref:DUF2515 family protein n=1 Tax=Cohnella sp. WGS1546 TaxID=3366810 RepID=UPI00372D4AD4